MKNNKKSFISMMLCFMLFVTGIFYIPVNAANTTSQDTVVSQSVYEQDAATVPGNVYGVKFAALTAEPTPAPQVVYNYKLKFENNAGSGAVADDFASGGYGYSDAENASPKGAKPTEEVDPNGKYGKCIKFTYPGYYVATATKRYGGTYVNAMKSPIMLYTGETVALVDYMKGVKTVAFWAKAPYSTYVGTGTREVDVSFLGVNASGGNVGTFKYAVYLKNTGDWQYFEVPFENFKNGTTSITSKLDEIAAYKLYIGVPYGKKYFGRDPGTDTLTNPWIEPVYIDEMVFDRTAPGTSTTPAITAITPPSVGEEVYFANAALADIKIEGEPVPDFSEIKNDSIIDVELPNNYTISNITSSIVEGVPENPGTQGSMVEPYEQIRSGPTIRFIPPTVFPGAGTLISTSADESMVKRYTLNFIKRYPLQVQKEQITGIQLDAPLTQGQKTITIPINNEGETLYGISVIAIVSEIATGTVKSVGFANDPGIAPGQTLNLCLSPVTVPDAPQNYKLTFYFWDGIRTANSIADSIAVGQ